MQVDLFGAFDKEVDNFSLNFSSVAPFWELEFNKEVKIDYRLASLSGISSEISKKLKETIL